MKTKKQSIVVLTPVFEDTAVVGQLLLELAAEYGPHIFVLVVDDGSLRHPIGEEVIGDAGLRGTVLRLSRNVGHQKAIAIGLNYLAKRVQECERIVIMDADGEDTPASIKDLLHRLEPRDVDLVVAQRRSRVETARFKAFYFLYKMIFLLLTGRKISFGNFMVMKWSALKRLTAMSELWTHLAATVLCSRLRLAFCPLDRGRRYAGRSKMNFVSLALHGFKGLMIFAEDVLVRVGILCSFLAILSVIGALAAVLLKIFGFATPGWFSIALGILMLVFLQTGMLVLMTLMLTGIVKSGRENIPDYRDFVEKELHVN
jgi:glycosyltransferase involved in cell wall biosynthesis